MSAHPSALARLAAVALLLACIPAARAAGPDKLWVFIGTYHGPKSKGIYRAELDLATGKLSTPELAAEVDDPSFLAVHPSQKFLYAVGELDKFKDMKSGAVSAFSLDPKTGTLKLLNQQPSGDVGPCQLTIDKQGKDVIVAHYGGGSTSVLPVGADGELGKVSCFVKHAGKGADPKRQETPHAHSATVDPTGKFVCVADLGLDKVLVYKFDPAKG